MNHPLGKENNMVNIPYIFIGVLLAAGCVGRWNFFSINREAGTFCCLLYVKADCFYDSINDPVRKTLRN